MNEGYVISVVMPVKPPHNLTDESILDSLLTCYGGAVAGGNKPGWRSL